jgi:hypothetical protein
VAATASMAAGHRTVGDLGPGPLKDLPEALVVRLRSFAAGRLVDRLGRGLDLAVDVLVDLVHASANVQDHQIGDNGDQSSQQPVLNEILAFLFLDEPGDQLLHT